MCGKNSTFTGIVLGCCLVMSVPSYGKSEMFVKDGPYLGVFGAYNTIGGEFTDSVTYVYEEEPLIYYDVPNVDSAFGYGIGGGNRKSVV